MIRILNRMSDCNSIHSIWKFTGHIFMSTEIGVANVQKKKKKDNFFCNLETCSQMPLSKWKAWLCTFFLFTGQCLGNKSKCIQLFAITWFSTALRSPHALVAAQTVRATVAEGADGMWQQLGHTASCTRLHKAHGPQVGHAWYSICFCCSRIRSYYFLAAKEERNHCPITSSLIHSVSG